VLLVKVLELVGQSKSVI